MIAENHKFQESRLLRIFDHANHDLWE